MKSKLENHLGEAALLLFFCLVTLIACVAAFLETDAKRRSPEAAACPTCGRPR